MSLKKTFIEKSKNKTADLEHKRKLAFNIQKYLDTVVKGKLQFSDLEAARRKAKNIKYHAMENLADYLEEFEKNFSARGGEVIYASDAQEAVDAIVEICKEYDAQSLVKSKSMVTEEIHLNGHLEENSIEPIETDLGEFIQQLDGEAPYHIVTPAMHKSKEDVAKLFNEKLGVEPNLPPYELTLIARRVLREKYTEAEVGLTGGNFILPDIGGIAVTENEGNARLSTSFPKIQIAVVGIEKMIPSFKDLSLFWPLLATYGTGQNVTVYNTIFTGPKTANEVDGPEKMYVVLLDNGRMNLYKDPNLRQSLYCIRCGSCLNSCPIYKNVGGHTYMATYSGPIGSVITPHLKGLKEYNHLSNASTLCGKCSEVCPVNIKIHDMLHYNRTLTVKEHFNDKTEAQIWKSWAAMMKSPSMMNMLPPAMKNLAINPMVRSSWTKNREKLVFKKPFSKQWKSRKD